MIARILRYLFICFALLLVSGAQADDVAIPQLKHRVTDLTGTLSTDQQAALESKLAQIEQQKGSQIAILIVPTTKPEEIEQYSVRVVDAWKIGRKKIDDGVLVLIAKDDHKMRIEVGYGLEGVIPDAIAKRVIAETMTPSFKRGDFYGGINAAVDILTGLISGEALLPAPILESNGNNHWEDMLPLLVFGGLILGALLRAVFGNFLGGAATSGVIGFAIWMLGGGLVAAIVLAIVVFVLSLANGAAATAGRSGYYSGSSGGGFGGGFSGGGGFGGGGASGSW